MAHITLSVPDDVQKEMKKHPEIKWSEIARRSIILKTAEIRKIMKANEFLALVDPETRRSVEATPDKEWASYYKNAKGKEWKRATYLTRV